MLARIEETESCNGIRQKRISGGMVFRFVSVALRRVARRATKESGKTLCVLGDTVIVKADTLESAYSKIEKIDKAESKPYRGGLNGIRVRWEYLGVTELVPIQEELKDGAEIAWTERKPRTLRVLKSLVRSKHQLKR